MRKLAHPFIVFVERFYPDPFVFAIGLTAVVYVMCLLLTGAGPLASLVAWGEGLASLLEFIAQIAITLITSHALAHTPPVVRLMERLGRVPRSTTVAYGLVAFVAGVASLFAWAFGLIIGGLIARQVGMEARRRGLRLHYPLLVASGYAGYVIWHMGYSSSAALFVATPGHALEEQVGGVIPVTETIFAGWNITTAIVALLTVPILMAVMQPKPDEGDEILEVPDRVIDDYEQSLARLQAELGIRVAHADDAESRSRTRPSSTATAERPDPAPAAGVSTLGQRLDDNRLISGGVGAALAAYLVVYFARNGLNLTLDVVNWSFLGLGLLLAHSPLHYVKLVANASAIVGQVILQYPFYAGISGMMIETGLVSVIAGWFTAISTAGTLGFWAFFSGGLVNMFIPSGGGQWAVQGPVFIEAAQTLGTAPSRVVMGVAYGDQWTNMIQPFWTIPILAIAGLHMRQIMGYTFVVLFVTFFIFGGGILAAGPG
ncbi:MAG: short-chain fatty acid transporter [Egibacteraceae bacterium]